MSIKITARELLFSCVAAPEMIQYYSEISVSLRSTERNILAYVSSYDRSCWRRSGFFEFNLKSHFYLFFRLYIPHIEDI